MNNNFRKAVETEREACARLVQGVSYKERYRQWPEITGVGEGADCVGTSEKACNCVDAARRAAQRYSDRFGYGRIESATVTQSEV